VCFFFGTDVPEPRSEVLRRLHQRLQLKVARLEGRELRHALCGQVAEGFGATGQQVPGAERCHDAVRFATRAALNHRPRTAIGIANNKDRHRFPEQEPTLQKELHCMIGQGLCVYL